VHNETENRIAYNDGLMQGAIPVESRYRYSVLSGLLEEWKEEVYRRKKKHSLV